MRHRNNHFAGLGLRRFRGPIPVAGFAYTADAQGVEPRQSALEPKFVTDLPLGSGTCKVKWVGIEPTCYRRVSPSRARIVLGSQSLVLFSGRVLRSECVSPSTPPPQSLNLCWASHVPASKLCFTSVNTTLTAGANLHRVRSVLDTFGRRTSNLTVVVRSFACSRCTPHSTFARGSI